MLRDADCIATLGLPFHMFYSQYTVIIVHLSPRFFSVNTFAATITDLHSNLPNANSNIQIPEAFLYAISHIFRTTNMEFRPFVMHCHIAF